MGGAQNYGLPTAKPIIACLTSMSSIEGGVSTLPMVTAFSSHRSLLQDQPRKNSNSFSAICSVSAIANVDLPMPEPPGTGTCCVHKAKILAAKKVTAELPIVVSGGDLEATGLIANLARPGGNVTGVGAATTELAEKNLELIADMLPVARHVAVLVNADSLFGATLLEHVQIAAQARNIEVKSFRVREPNELDADFASFAEWKPDALLAHPALPRS